MFMLSKKTIKELQRDTLYSENQIFHNITSESPPTQFLILNLQ